MASLGRPSWRVAEPEFERSPVHVDVREQAPESARVTWWQVVRDSFQYRPDLVVVWAAFRNTASFVTRIPASVVRVFQESSPAAQIPFDLPRRESSDLEASEFVLAPTRQTRELRQFACALVGLSGQPLYALVNAYLNGPPTRHCPLVW